MHPSFSMFSLYPTYRDVGLSIRGTGINGGLLGWEYNQSGGKTEKKVHCPPPNILTPPPHNLRHSFLWGAEKFSHRVIKNWIRQNSTIKEQCQGGGYLLLGRNRSMGVLIIITPQCPRGHYLGEVSLRLQILLGQ